jgi:hypothetical protein
MSVRKVDHINPDGVTIIIDWSLLLPGMSVFVPCLNFERGKKQITDITERQRITTDIKITTHEGALGLRVWRII